MKRIDFRPMILGLGLMACGDSDGRAAQENHVPSVAAVVGTVVDSSGDPVEGAEVLVKSFWLTEPPAPQHEGVCEQGSRLSIAKSRTNAVGQFQVILKGDFSELDGCGTIIVRTDEEHSDTISGIPVHFRYPQPETANVHMVVTAQKNRVLTVAAVTGMVVDSSGDSVEGAEVLVKSFWLTKVPAPHGGGVCEQGTELSTSETRTNAGGQFRAILKGNLSELDGCGTIVVRTDEEHSDTISGIPLRFRHPPPETANVHVVLRQ